MNNQKTLHSILNEVIDRPDNKHLKQENKIINEFLKNIPMDPVANFYNKHGKLPSEIINNE